MTALHVHTDTDEEQDEEVDACAVVFGGSSISMCLPDTWCLDLKWRVAGVKGFDSHATSRTRDACSRASGPIEPNMGRRGK